MSLWLDYVSSVQDSKWYLKLITLALALSFAVSIGYSRFFLGVHSLNQILYGLSAGLWFAFTANFIIREPLNKLTSALIEGKAQITAEKLGLASTGIVCLAIVTQMINYDIAMNFENPSEWDSMQVQKCGKDSLADAY